MDGSALTFTDQSLAPGKTHRYRIKSNDNPPRSEYTQVAVPHPVKDENHASTATSFILDNDNSQ